MKKALFVTGFLMLGGISLLSFGKFSTAKVSGHLIEAEIRCSIFEQASARGSYGLGICACEDDDIENLKVMARNDKFNEYKSFLTNNDFHQIATVIEQIENHIQDKDYRNYIRNVHQYHQLIAELDDEDRRNILNALERL